MFAGELNNAPEDWSSSFRVHDRHTSFGATSFVDSQVNPIRTSSMTSYKLHELSGCRCSACVAVDTREIICRDSSYICDQLVVISIFHVCIKRLINHAIVAQALD